MVNFETLKPCNLETWLLLFLFHPNLIAKRVPGSVLHRIVLRNAHRSGDGLDDLLQLPPHILTGRGIHCGRLDLIDKLSFIAWNYNDAGEMRIVFDRFVFKIDVERRDENKKKDQRDHDVVVQASPLIRPENVSA